MCVNGENQLQCKYRTGICYYSVKKLKKAVFLLRQKNACLAAVQLCFRTREDTDQRERFFLQ
jgi:hypothetical protein